MCPVGGQITLCVNQIGPILPPIAIANYRKDFCTVHNEMQRSPNILVLKSRNPKYHVWGCSLERVTLQLFYLLFHAVNTVKLNSKACLFSSTFLFEH